MTYVSVMNFPGLPERGPAFHYALVEMAERLGMNPSYIAGVMYHESGFNPQARNPYSGATGLIQWMPATAKAFGTTVDELFSMTALQQMAFVEKYFKTFSKMVAAGATRMVDYYLMDFYPAAIGKPSSYVIADRDAETAARFGRTEPIKPNVYAQNSGMDRNRDGVLDVADMETEAALILQAAAGRPELEVQVGWWASLLRGSFLSVVALAVGGYAGYRGVRYYLEKK